GVADRAHPPLGLRPRETLEPWARFVRRFPREDEFRDARLAASRPTGPLHGESFRRAEQPLVRIQQPADVLSRLQRPKKQDVAVLRRGCAWRPDWRARGAHDDSLARDA